MTSILLPGIAGLIESNFTPYFLEKYHEYNIVNLDLLTYLSKKENVYNIGERTNLQVVDTIDWYLNKYGLNL